MRTDGKDKVVNDTLLFPSFPGPPNIHSLDYNVNCCKMPSKRALEPVDLESLVGSMSRPKAALAEAGRPEDRGSRRKRRRGAADTQGG
jgi:hypothetical protein